MYNIKIIIAIIIDKKTIDSSNKTKIKEGVNKNEEGLILISIYTN